MRSLLICFLVQICASSSSNQEDTTAKSVAKCLGEKIKDSTLAKLNCTDLVESTKDWLDNRQSESLQRRADEDEDQDLLQTGHKLQSNRQTHRILRENREMVGGNTIVTTAKPLTVYGIFPDMLCKDWINEFGGAVGESVGQEYGCVVKRIQGETWAAACSFRNYIYSN